LFESNFIQHALLTLEERYTLPIIITREQIPSSKGVETKTISNYHFPIIIYYYYYYYLKKKKIMNKHLLPTNQTTIQSNT